MDTGIRNNIRSSHVRGLLTGMVNAALLGAAFFCVAHAQTSAATYKTTLQKFFSTYVSSALDAKFRPTMSFDVPTVWLYSPKGDMVMQASSAEDGALSKLTSAFPPKSSIPPLAGQPNLAFMDTVLAKVVSPPPAPLASQTTQWTAVLFLTDATDCKQCAGFERTMQDLAAKNADGLHLVRVMLAE